MQDGDDIGEIIRQYLQREDMRDEEPGFSQSPFTLHIRFARNPVNFKLPSMHPYDGKLDPIVNLVKYEQHMEVARASEEITCKCFSIYLTDLTTMWFYRLEPGSIDSYSQLIRSFKN